MPSFLANLLRSGAAPAGPSPRKVMVSKKPLALRDGPRSPEAAPNEKPRMMDTGQKLPAETMGTRQDLRAAPEPRAAVQAPVEERKTKDPLGASVSPSSVERTEQRPSTAATPATPFPSRIESAPPSTVDRSDVLQNRRGRERLVPRPFPRAPRVEFSALKMKSVPLLGGVVAEEAVDHGPGPERREDADARQEVQASAVRDAAREWKGSVPAAFPVPARGWGEDPDRDVRAAIGGLEAPDPGAGRAQKAPAATHEVAAPRATLAPAARQVAQNAEFIPNARERHRGNGARKDDSPRIHIGRIEVEIVQEEPPEPEPPAGHGAAQEFAADRTAELLVRRGLRDRVC